MDAEDFAIWRESTGTQWVLKRLSAKADEIDRVCANSLYAALTLSPDEWAALHVRAAKDAGVALGLRQLGEMDFEDLTDEEPKDGAVD